MANMNIAQWQKPTTATLTPSPAPQPTPPYGGGNWVWIQSPSGERKRIWYSPSTWYPSGNWAKYKDWKMYPGDEPPPFPRGPIYPGSEQWNPTPTPTPTSQPPWYQKPGFGTMTYVWNPEKKGWDTSQIVGPGGNEPPYSKGFIPWYQASQEWRKWITEKYPDYEPPPFPRGPIYPGSPEWNPKPAAGNGLSEVKPFSATLNTPLPTPTPPTPLPPSPLPPQPPQPNIPTPKPEYPTPGRPRKPFDNIFAWRKKGPLWW